MKTGLLKRTIADLAPIPLGTAADRVKELQARCMLTKGERGRHGGAVMTATDRINALLACIFDPAPGRSIAETVTRIRRLPLSLAYYSPLGKKLSIEENARCAIQVVEGLDMKFDNFGTTLDGIVQAMRSGAFETWTDGLKASVSADFRGERQVLLAFDRPQVNVSAVFEFSSEKSSDAPIERFLRINTAAFARLAVDEPT